MVHHATNRRGMQNAIGPVDLLAPFLEAFEAAKVLVKYSKWEDLFDVIQQNYTPPGRMDRANPRNSWVILSKSILSIAKYVERFKSIDDFDIYVGKFFTDTPDTRWALPLVLGEEIFGYRFALACDLIKENISPEFAKPDVHIKAIFIGIGKSEKDASDYQVFRDVVEFAKSISQTPYAVDKLFWLIGSGKFYLSGIKVATNRQAFIDRINTPEGKLL